jgi:hypothetical protein
VVDIEVQDGVELWLVHISAPNKDDCLSKSSLFDGYQTKSLTAQVKVGPSYVTEASVPARWSSAVLPTEETTEETSVRDLV